MWVVEKFKLSCDAVEVLERTQTLFAGEFGAGDRGWGGRCHCCPAHQNTWVLVLLLSEGRYKLWQNFIEQ